MHTVFLAQFFSFRFMSLAFSTSLETLHPSLWRASQLARGVGDYVECGFPQLSQELPGGGWPTGALTELFIEHGGSAELQLLRPALNAHSLGQIAFLQTPYQPQAMALAQSGISLDRLLWLRCNKMNDALWTAEQILRSGSCAALLFWQNQIKVEALRRLHLVAQHGRTLFYVIRPLNFVHHPSPAILRIQVKLAQRGLQLSFIKRRGAQKHEALFLPMTLPSPMLSRIHLPSHASSNENDTIDVGRHSPTESALRSFSPTLVG